MKNYILILFLLVPLVFAQELELNKDEFLRGETIIADINTKYALTSELTNINAHILDSNNREVSAPFYVTKLTDSKYIVYMTIPNTFLGTDYTLRIDNVYYYKEGVLVHFVQNVPFKLTSTSQAGELLSINPAGAYIEDLGVQNYFYINLKNTGSKATNIYLKYGIDYFDINPTEYLLYPGDSKKIKVSVKQSGENIIDVSYNNNLSSYKVKVFAEGNLPYEQITQAPSNALRFTNIEGPYTKSIFDNQVERGVIRIRNGWTTKLTNLKVAISSSLYGVVSVTPNTITTLNPGSEAEIQVVINENENLHADYSGNIIIESDEGAKLTLPIQLYYVPGVEEPELVTSTEKVDDTKEPTIPTQPDIEKQEMKLGTTLALIAVLFVIIVSIILLLKLKKSKPTRKRKF